jgi:Nif-specific regulatory protein
MLQATSELPTAMRRAAPRSADVALYGVYEISKLLTQPMPLEATLTKVLNLLSSFLDMRHALIALLGEDGVADTVVASGLREDSARRYFDTLPEKAIGQIVVTQMPLVVENVREDALFTGSAFARDCDASEVVAFIGVPIKDRGRVVGTLTVDRDLRDPGDVRFTFDDDVRFLTMVGNLLGQTVRLQRFIARDRERMLEEQRRLEKALVHRVESEQFGADSHYGPSLCGIVGQSPKLRAVLEKVRIVAKSHSTVLLRGESGTGKELFARALHELSPRRDKAFVTLNCAALPESVLESELFGHEKGAFTGAQAQRKGRFELADGGTLFLDEIGEISAAFQAKLLRVLQIGEFERVGGSSTLKVDVRIVAATNRDLESAVAAGDFRADLYYRISVVPILLPPLRERTSDIPLLAQEFLQRFNVENGTQHALTEAAQAVLVACSFPGNVRELENCIRRTATLARGAHIVAGDFACRQDECLSAVLWRKAGGMAPPPAHEGFIPLPIGRGPSTPRPPTLPPPSVSADSLRPSRPPVAPVALAPEETDDEDVEGLELTDRDRLITVLESVGWVQAKAARVLGLTPRQIGYALRKHEIPIKKF